MIADDGIYGTGYFVERIICFWSWNMSEYISGTKNGSTHPFFKLYVFLKSETIQGVENITHPIHGTGIFTYMNGWFLWEI